MFKFKSKPQPQPDNPSDVDTSRLVEEIKPYIYALIILMTLGAGVTAVLLWSLLGIIRVLFFS